MTVAELRLACVFGPCCRLFFCVYGPNAHCHWIIFVACQGWSTPFRWMKYVASVFNVWCGALEENLGSSSFYEGNKTFYRHPLFPCSGRPWLACSGADNEIGDEGARALAEALTVNATIAKLQLASILSLLPHLATVVFPPSVLLLCVCVFAGFMYSMYSITRSLSMFTRGVYDSGPE